MGRSTSTETMSYILPIPCLRSVIFR